MLAHKAISDEAVLYSSSGKEIIQSSGKLLQNENNGKGPKFMIGCEASLETLGKNIFEYKGRIEEKIKNSPYLITFMGGESISVPGKRVKTRIHSLNSISLD